MVWVFDYFSIIIIYNIFINNNKKQNLQNQDETHKNVIKQIIKEEIHNMLEQDNITITVQKIKMYARVYEFQHNGEITTIILWL